MPSLTVILPARNAQKTVTAAVASVLAQTFGDFELLAVDDGSTDGTGDLLEALAARDERMRVFHTPGLGVALAVNLALAQAQTALIARMDADDVTSPTRFAKSLALLAAQPALSAVGTQVEITREDRPVSPNLQRYGQWLNSLTSPALVARDRFIESPLCNPSTVIRKAALDEVGGWRDGPFPEDYELWLRLIEQGHVLSVVPEVLHQWSDHDHRVTRTDSRYAREGHLRLKADYLSRLFPRVTLWGATDTGRSLSKLLTARGVKVDRFVELDARKLGQTIHGVPVIHPDQVQRDGSHVLSCVAAQGAREQIRSWLSERGFVEGVDFTCVT